METKASLPGSERAETDELRLWVAAALAGMPEEWRRALLMRHVNGLERSEVARAIGRPEQELDEILDHARAYLRVKLLESERIFEDGCRRGGGAAAGSRAPS
jgi:DNA-directed RNA polymerase specialized sigma24 family protein